MLVFCLWIWLIGRSLSAPLAAPLFETGNTTSYESAWQNAPTERGTSTLLISCLTTLFFAAWTAYHPNVPSANSGWGATATRLQWIVMTAFAPEIVLWSAWTQYRDARRLLYEMNKVLRARQEQASPENFPGQQRWAPNGVLKSTPSHTWPLDRGLGGQGSKCLVAGAHQKAEKQNAELWTIEQAFFAVAGGIGVDSSSFSSHKSVCFTGRGLLLLARCGLLPTIPLKQIQDKSKADALSRVLVCVQGAWFMAQTIARWIQDLPVSLLELHAFVHVVCAICMYALWWSKGYNIEQSLYIQGEDVLDFAALFSMEPLFARRGPYGLGPDDLHGLMHCSCQSFGGLKPELAETAHQYPLKKLTTWRWGITHMDDFPLTPRKVDKLKVGEQSRRADRALECIRLHDVHLRWLEYGPKGRYFGCQNRSLEFADGPYIAHCAGNAIPEGAISWSDMISSAFEPEVLVDPSKYCPYASQLGPNGHMDNAFIWHDPYRPWLPTPPVAAHSRQEPMSGRSLEDAATKYPYPTRSRTTPESPLLAEDGALELRSLLKPSQTWSPSARSQIPPSSATTGKHPRRPAPVDGLYRKDLPSGLRKRDKYYHKLHIDGVILVFICAAYSAAHLTAWNHPFPTKKEMWVWRAFCLLFMTVPAASIWAATTFLLGRFLQKTCGCWKSGTLWNMLVVTLPSAFLAQFYWMYIPARMGLLVLALMALRKPVDGTYEGVLWSQFVPHVS